MLDRPEKPDEQPELEELCVVDQAYAILCLLHRAAPYCLKKLNEEERSFLAAAEAQTIHLIMVLTGDGPGEIKSYLDEVIGEEDKECPSGS